MVIKVKNIENFNKLLVIKGFTQTSLAEEAGCTTAYMNKIANGKSNPSPTLAKKICDLLSVDFGEIFFVNNACKSYHESSVV